MVYSESEIFFNIFEKYIAKIYLKIILETLWLCACESCRNHRSSFSFLKFFFADLFSFIYLLFFFWKRYSSWLTRFFIRVSSSYLLIKFYITYINTISCIKCTFLSKWNARKYKQNFLRHVQDGLFNIFIVFL